MENDVPNQPYDKDDLLLKRRYLTFFSAGLWPPSTKYILVTATTLIKLTVQDAVKISFS